MCVKFHLLVQRLDVCLQVIVITPCAFSTMCWCLCFHRRDVRCQRLGLEEPRRERHPAGPDRVAAGAGTLLHGA